MKENLSKMSFMEKGSIAITTEMSSREIFTKEKDKGRGISMELMADCRLENGFRTSFQCDYFDDFIEWFRIFNETEIVCNQLTLIVYLSLSPASFLAEE